MLFFRMKGLAHDDQLSFPRHVRWPELWKRQWLGARCCQLRFHVGMTRLVGRQAQIPGGHAKNEVVINGSQREDICAR